MSKPSRAVLFGELPGEFLQQTNRARRERLQLI
jgi:hypothetical protein